MSFWRGLLRILGIVIGLVGGPVGKLIGIGLTLLSQGGAGRGSGGLQSSPRYGFDTLSNVASPGGPVPIVYGQELVAPAIISVNTVQKGAEQILKVLCLVSEGEIESITQVRLNDTAIESYTGASYETQLGTETQAAIKGFNQVGRPIDVNVTLQRNEKYVHEMRGTADELVVNIAWQGGLYHIKPSSGKLANGNAFMRVQYKPYGAADTAYAAWTGNLEGWANKGGGLHIHSAASQAVYRYQMRIVLLTTGRFVFKFTAESGNENGYIQVGTISNVIEVASDGRAYANTAVLGITCPASAQLGGALPRVTCVVKGRKVYDPRTGLTAWSRNPILILRDLLLNERFGLGEWISSAEIDDGVGGSFRTVADACDADVTTPTGLTEDAHQFDMVLDSRAPARDWFDQILRSCRSTLFPSQGKLRLARYASGSSVRSFSEDEGDGIRKGIVAVNDHEGGRSSSLVERWLEEDQRWNAARFLFVDRDEQYKRRTVLLRDQRISIDTGAWIVGTSFALGSKIKSANLVGGETYAVVTRAAAVGDSYVYYAHDEIQSPFIGSFTGASNPLTAANPPQTQVYPTGAPEYITPERLLETQLFGVTRRTQAQREARHHLLLALYCPRFVTFDVFLGDLDVEPGDHIAITSTRLGYAAKQFTVIAISIQADGFASIDAREYDARVFSDGIDPVPNAPTFQPGGTIPPGLRNDILAAESTGTVKATASTSPGAGLQTSSSASMPTSEVTSVKVSAKEKS